MQQDDTTHAHRYACSDIYPTAPRTNTDTQTHTHKRTQAHTHTSTKGKTDQAKFGRQPRQHHPGRRRETVLEPVSLARGYPAPQLILRSQFIVSLYSNVNKELIFENFLLTTSNFATKYV